PRASYATPATSGTTRAPRRRQLPTNHCHAALPLGQPAHISVIRRRRRLILRCPSPASGSLWKSEDPIRQKFRLTVGPSISARLRPPATSWQSLIDLSIGCPTSPPLSPSDAGALMDACTDLALAV